MSSRKIGNDGPVAGATTAEPAAAPARAARARRVDAASVPSAAEAAPDAARIVGEAGSSTTSRGPSQVIAAMAGKLPMLPKAVAAKVDKASADVKYEGAGPRDWAKSLDDAAARIQSLMTDTSVTRHKQAADGMAALLKDLDAIKKEIGEPNRNFLQRVGRLFKRGEPTSVEARLKGIFEKAQQVLGEQKQLYGQLETRLDELRKDQMLLLQQRAESLRNRDKVAKKIADLKKIIDETTATIAGLPEDDAQRAAFEVELAKARGQLAKKARDYDAFVNQAMRLKMCADRNNEFIKTLESLLGNLTQGMDMAVRELDLLATIIGPAGSAADNIQKMTQLMSALKLTNEATNTVVEKTAELNLIMAQLRQETQDFMQNRDQAALWTLEAANAEDRRQTEAAVDKAVEAATARAEGQQEADALEAELARFRAEQGAVQASAPSANRTWMAGKLSADRELES